MCGQCTTSEQNHTAILHKTVSSQSLLLKQQLNKQPWCLSPLPLEVTRVQKFAGKGWAPQVSGSLSLSPFGRSSIQWVKTTHAHWFLTEASCHLYHIPASRSLHITQWDERIPLVLMLKSSKTKNDTQCHYMCFRFFALLWGLSPRLMLWTW